MPGFGPTFERWASPAYGGPALSSGEMAAVMLNHASRLAAAAESAHWPPRAEELRVLLREILDGIDRAAPTPYLDARRPFSPEEVARVGGPGLAVTSPEPGGGPARLLITRIPVARTEDPR